MLLPVGLEIKPGGISKIVFDTEDGKQKFEPSTRKNCLFTINSSLDMNIRVGFNYNNPAFDNMERIRNNVGLLKDFPKCEPTRISLDGTLINKIKRG